MEKIGQRVGAFVVSRAARSEEGQGLVEYGLILALVAGGCIVALGVLGDNISGFLDSVGAALKLTA